MIDRRHFLAGAAATAAAIAVTPSLAAPLPQLGAGPDDSAVLQAMVEGRPVLVDGRIFHPEGDIVIEYMEFRIGAPIEFRRVQHNRTVLIQRSRLKAVDSAYPSLLDFRGGSGNVSVIYCSLYSNGRPDIYAVELPDGQAVYGT